MRHCGLTPMREPLQGRCIGDGYGDDEVSCANALLLALSRGVAAKACRKAPRALTSPRSLSLAGRTQIGVAPGGGSVTELFVFREPIVRRLTAGGNRIRTIGTALRKGSLGSAERRCWTDRLDGIISPGRLARRRSLRADPFSTAVSLTAGPMVRIRLPPAGSPVRT